MRVSLKTPLYGEFKGKHSRLPATGTYVDVDAPLVRLWDRSQPILFLFLFTHRPTATLPRGEERKRNILLVSTCGHRTRTSAHAHSKQTVPRKQRQPHAFPFSHATVESTETEHAHVNEKVGPTYIDLDAPLVGALWDCSEAAPPVTGHALAHHDGRLLVTLCVVTAKVETYHPRRPSLPHRARSQDVARDHQRVLQHEGEGLHARAAEEARVRAHHGAPANPELAQLEHALAEKKTRSGLGVSPSPYCEQHFIGADGSRQQQRILNSSRCVCTAARVRVCGCVEIREQQHRIL